MDDAHGHAHGHGLGGHSHGVSAHTDLRWLTIALALNALFMPVEVAVGVIASSLAVLSDAAHLLTDAGAIGWPCTRRGSRGDARRAR